MVMASSFGWGQNADLQYMLDKSFCNFLDHFHKETSIIKNFSEFRVVDSYIPYGLEMVSNNLHDARVVTVHADKIHNLIKTRKKYKYSYAQLGSIYMTGADTISFQIGFWKYIEPIVRASYLGSNFYTMFGINDRGEAEEAHLTQKEIAKRIERSRVWDIVPDSSYDGGGIEVWTYHQNRRPDSTFVRSGRPVWTYYQDRRTLCMDSVCYRALTKCLELLADRGVRPNDVYINDEHFPAFLYRDAEQGSYKAFFPYYFSSIKHIPLGQDYKSWLKDGQFVVGWPQLLVQKGRVAIKVFYLTANAPKITMTQSVEAVYKYQSSLGMWVYEDCSLNKRTPLTPPYVGEIHHPKTCISNSLEEAASL